MAGPKNWAAKTNTAITTTLVTARAVAPLNVLVEYLLPLVRPGGLAVIYKGPGAPQEFIEARQAIKLLAGDAVRLAPVEVPFLDEKRFILLIKKLRPTPCQYPRVGRDWHARSHYRQPPPDD